MNTEEMLEVRDGIKPPLYEGKAKQLYSTDNPDELLMVFKDDITAGNGAKKDTMSEKGKLNCTISKKYMNTYMIIKSILIILVHQK
tara:strand:+ start:163 stop:420 length:258 start_codon:yes stop_codon:yes gene_type:complete